MPKWILTEIKHVESGIKYKNFETSEVIYSKAIHIKKSLWPLWPKPLNIDNDRKGYNMSPTKNRKRLFFNFHMKFMMYLDYSNWKFPIPSVGEGGKRGGKLSHCIDKPKFLLFITLSLLSSVVACSVTMRKVKGSNPADA